jgi:hypothetical protein
MPYGSCPHGFILEIRARFEADLDQQFPWLFQVSSIADFAEFSARQVGKTTFYIKWICAFDNFISQLFHTPHPMRYLMSKRSPEGEA